MENKLIVCEDRYGHYVAVRELELKPQTYKIIKDHASYTLEVDGEPLKLEVFEATIKYDGTLVLRCYAEDGHRIVDGFKVDHA